MKQLVTVLIPAYKPSVDLLSLVRNLITLGFAHIVVVDDGSGPDYTGIFASLASDTTVLWHEQNRGKGRALKTGLGYIYKHLPGSGGVITCDADGQHKPSDIQKVAEAFLAHPDALVLGSRAFDKDVPLRSALGNTVTRSVYYLASGVRLRDTQTGLRAFPRSMIPGLLELEGERYEFEINMLLHAARDRMPIREVDIETVYLDGNHASHFRTIRDSAIVYKQIFKFSLSSFGCFLIDCAVLFLLKWILHGVDSGLALLVSVVGARAISSYVNYVLNRNVVFRKNGKNAVLKYYALVLCILGMNYALLYVLNILAGFPLFWAKIVTEFVLFLVSYNVQKRLIFTIEPLAVE